MNKFYPAFATVLLLFASFSFVSAQEDEEKIFQKPPRQPAYIFDAYNPNDISVEDEKQKLKLFVSRVKDTPDAFGYINIYRGAIDYKLDYEKKAGNLKDYLTELSKENNINSIDIYPRLNGFRNESSIELIIKPKESKDTLFSSNISLLEVKYFDDAAIEKGFVQKTGQQLLDSLIKRVEPPYPSAAKAVRVSGEVAVLTKIDEKGNVIEAKSFIGHPLLRAMCELAVRNWQFKPEIQNKVPVKVIGITVCDFQLPEPLQVDY